MSELKPVKIIEIDGVIHVVDGSYDDFIAKGNKFRKDNCYIREGLVYIYGGKAKTDAVPGYFYKTDDDKYTFVEPRDPEDQSAVKVKDVSKAKEEMCDPKNIKEITDDIAADTADLHIFAPPMKDTDDPLKRIVKMALIDMQVDLKLYRHEFKKEYDLTNLKASVTKEAPMTMKYFTRWVEILHLRVDLVVDSSEDSKVVRKLTQPITYTIE